MKFSRTQTRLAVATFTVGLGMGLTMATSGAASPSQTQCEADGGTFAKSNGTVTCTNPVGNSESSPLNPTRSQTVKDSGQGNLSNKEDSSGPGNSQG